jgi:hypothetical protein
MSLSQAEKDAINAAIAAKIARFKNEKFYEDASFNAAYHSTFDTLYETEANKQKVE